MTFPDLVQLYGHLPQAGALAKTLEDNSVRRVFLQGLVASSQPLLFASVAKKIRRTILFILDDADEAAYFSMTSVGWVHLLIISFPLLTVGP